MDIDSLKEMWMVSLRTPSLTALLLNGSTISTLLVKKLERTTHLEHSPNVQAHSNDNLYSIHLIHTRTHTQSVCSFLRTVEPASINECVLWTGRDSEHLAHTASSHANTRPPWGRCFRGELTFPGQQLKSDACTQTDSLVPAPAVLPLFCLLHLVLHTTVINIGKIEH